ncbi:hemerythrin domain-containing protein [Anaerotalea alkaliphila]|uniref:Diguanylate cyclase n=1 Tax=Anaerotalea alkaliphila TaxID=2662126 RepID=A0A7X5HT35_9FIRM|nr:hemerythrin domain-containing protein [Anaerotalea alkaliphila]NDL66129.1 diguanylate cyclase [Anaerotalea alkaliphila]
MNEELLQDFFKKSPLAFSYQKAVLDGQGTPTDYLFLKVNDAFEDLTGLHSDDVVGNNHNTVFSAAEDFTPQWTLAYSQALQDSKPVILDQFHQQLGIWTTTTLFLIDAPFFACIYAPRQESLVAQEILDGLEGLESMMAPDFFRKRLEEEMERSDRFHDPLALAVLALDGLEGMQASWGTAVVREVLVQLAETTASLIRKYDILTLHGREQLELLMPKTSLPGAMAVAERVRSALDRIEHPVVGKVTATLVVSERTPGESLEDWMALLEEALESSLANGGNQVVQVAGVLPSALDAGLLEWRPFHASGNREIDGQHQELMRLARELLPLSDGADPQTLAVRIDSIVERLVEHFQTEEQALSDAGYPDLEKHAKIHKNLVGKAFQLKESYRNGAVGASAFASFLAKELILEHILKEDLLYFPAIQRKG